MERHSEQLLFGWWGKWMKRRKKRGERRKKKGGEKVLGRLERRRGVEGKGRGESGKESGKENENGERGAKMGEANVVKEEEKEEEKGRGPCREGSKNENGWMLGWIQKEEGKLRGMKNKKKS